MTYEIVHGEFACRRTTGIKCLVCKRTSWNPNDVKNKYCGGCHRYHDDLARSGPPWDGLSP